MCKSPSHLGDLGASSTDQYTDFPLGFAGLCVDHQTRFASYNITSKSQLIIYRDICKFGETEKVSENILANVKGLLYNHIFQHKGKVLAYFINGVQQPKKHHAKVKVHSI